MIQGGLADHCYSPEFDLPPLTISDEHHSKSKAILPAKDTFKAILWP